MSTALTMLTVAVVVLCGSWSASTPRAVAQDADLVVVVPPIEVGTTEVTTTVLRLEPSAIVGALTVIIEFPDAVFVTATEPLVSAPCEAKDNFVSFSGFEITGWTAPVELCRITVRGAQVARSGTPTITIRTAAGIEGNRLVGTTDAGLISVGSAPPTVVTATPTPVPTPQPTPAVEATPTPDAPAEPTPAVEATPTPDAPEEPVSQEPVSQEPVSQEPEPEPELTPTPLPAPSAEGEAPASPQDDPADSEPDPGDSTDDARGGRLPGEVEENADGVAADNDNPASDETNPDQANPDQANPDQANPDQASDDSDSASPVTLPPIPAADGNRSLLLGLVAAALFAVGALLAVGARSANQDTALR